MENAWYREIPHAPLLRLCLGWVSNRLLEINASRSTDLSGISGELMTYFAVQNAACPGVECDSWEEAREVAVKWQKQGYPARIICSDCHHSDSLWSDAEYQQAFTEY
jgi:hypothetical protein